MLAGELRTCRLTQFVRKIDVLTAAREQQAEKTQRWSAMLRRTLPK